MRAGSRSSSTSVPIVTPPQRMRHDIASTHRRSSYGGPVTPFWVMCVPVSVLFFITVSIGFARFQPLIAVSQALHIVGFSVVTGGVVLYRHIAGLEDADSVLEELSESPWKWLTVEMFVLVIGSGVHLCIAVSLMTAVARILLGVKIACGFTAIAICAALIGSSRGSREVRRRNVLFADVAIFLLMTSIALSIAVRCVNKAGDDHVLVVVRHPETQPGDGHPSGAGGVGGATNAFGLGWMDEGSEVAADERAVLSDMINRGARK
ncbi:unnamed protein product [Vitrella brassicaformis CCMP3155]|uniref:Transmembrane protein n=2 Tax=Vitrella brassicaformis TaxID=1169539 RepID=A0A0G4ERC4_VITBC|nr:unnamed protein product [Vitrella brassicaformis CCMP3155]|eukprot:CEM00818.1 unnamed protein product [Vitrella brassicaformis CCMP3155]